VVRWSQRTPSKGKVERGILGLGKHGAKRGRGGGAGAGRRVVLLQVVAKKSPSEVGANPHKKPFSGHSYIKAQNGSEVRENFT